MEIPALETIPPAVITEDITNAYIAEQKDQWIIDFIHEKNARVIKYVNSEHPENRPEILITFSPVRPT
jgi:hypothetical protein